MLKRIRINKTVGPEANSILTHYWLQYESPMSLSHCNPGVKQTPGHIAIGRRLKEEAEQFHHLSGRFPPLQIPV